MYLQQLQELLYLEHSILLQHLVHIHKLVQSMSLPSVAEAEAVEETGGPSTDDVSVEQVVVVDTTQPMLAI
jgi:hypothetical protein